MNKKEYNSLNILATKLSYRLRDRGDLETKNSDMEDFIIMPIWEIKEIVVAAYILGKESNVKF